MPSRRPSLVVFTAVALVATALALPASSGAAASTPDYCASLGLTNATVRPILGPHVKVSVYPNAGQDLGDCVISDLKGQDAHADVEVYPAALSASLFGQYAGGAASHKHLKGLTDDAQVVTGKNNGYRHGGPTALFTTPSVFVTIDGYPPLTLYAGTRHRRIRPATTVSQVTRLARLIYPHVL